MKMFDAGKTRMIGLPYGEKKTMTIMLSSFHLIPERYVRTDRRTDRFAISISRVSMLTRDRNGADTGNSACINCLQVHNLEFTSSVVSVCVGSDRNYRRW